MKSVIKWGNLDLQETSKDHVLKPRVWGTCEKYKQKYPISFKGLEPSLIQFIVN